eukprot:GHVH01004314.1.p1 GENE.GHVH01004314.1~~GHVH01004314.1.p1  ORF type:complete len:484 (+),score=75.31 GHVH01004314.1:93-1544(+)
MEFFQGRRLVFFLVDGIDNEAHHELKQQSITDMKSIFSSHPTKFIFVTNHGEETARKAKQCLEESHLLSSEYSVYHFDNCNTFCNLLSDMNYKSVLFSELEGHVVLFLSTSMLSNIYSDSEVDAHDFWNMSIASSVNRHMKGLEESAPMMSVFTTPDANSSLHTVVDDSSCHIVQWGTAEDDNTVKLDREEMLRSKASTFSIYHGFCFPNMVMINDNATISEMLSDGASTLQEFVKNTVDSGLMRPFPMFHEPINCQIGRSLPPASFIDPFFGVLDINEDLGDEFNEEVKAFVIQGILNPEAMKFKILELKTYRLSSNETDENVLAAALETILEFLSLPGRAPSCNIELMCPLSSSQFIEWFKDHQVNLIWDMFFVEDQTDYDSCIYDTILAFCVRCISEGCTVPNLFGRVFKVLHDTVEELCTNSFPTEGVNVWLNSARGYNDASHIYDSKIVEELFTSAEFSQFLEWCQLDSSSDSDSDSS